MKYLIPFLILASVSLSSIQAQEVMIDTTQAPVAKEATGEDNLPVDMARRFSLVFNRGFQLVDRANDSIPINGASSGTFFLGGGIRIPLGGQKAGIRLAPGISWTNITYNQTNLKQFPTPSSDSTNLSVEKHSLTHIDLPLSFFFNLTRDEDGDPRIFIEVGGYASYLMAASYKTKFEDANGLRIKSKIRDLHALEGDKAEFERLRYGLFARAGFKWFAVYVDYRLSDVFDEFSGTIINPQGEGFRNPVLEPLQIGLSIFL